MKVVQVKLNLCYYNCQCWMQEHYYWGKSDKETKKNLKSLNTKAKVGQIQLRSSCLGCNDISSYLFHCSLIPAPRKKQRSADLIKHINLIARKVIRTLLSYFVRQQQFTALGISAFPGEKEEEKNIQTLQLIVFEMNLHLKFPLEF